MSRQDDGEFVDFDRGASPRLLKTAWFICGDPVQAEELVLAALERVYLRGARIQDGDPLAYTRRVLLNLHIDARRRSKRETVVEAMPERPTRDAGPEDVDHVVRLLALLPLRERHVVVMPHYAGLPEAEVADLLGISLGSVKSNSSRGLAKLRESLAREENSRVR